MYVVYMYIHSLYVCMYVSMYTHTCMHAYVRERERCMQVFKICIPQVQAMLRLWLHALRNSHSKHSNIETCK